MCVCVCLHVSPEAPQPAETPRFPHSHCNSAAPPRTLSVCVASRVSGSVYAVRRASVRVCAARRASVSVCVPARGAAGSGAPGAGRAGRPTRSP